METSLAILFNTSIETSQFLNYWKLARVTPIFKGGNRSDKSNYRPISILPVISKLFEKLIATSCNQYMTENNMLSSNQSGFRRLHSTLSCLLKNTDDWASGQDLRKQVGLAFIDVRKAFVTVNHYILCQKLKQFCRVNGIDSEINSIYIRIPQGSSSSGSIGLFYFHEC